MDRMRRYLLNCVKPNFYVDIKNTIDWQLSSINRIHLGMFNREGLEYYSYF